MLTGKYLALYDFLINRIDKDRIFHDPLRTLAYSADASFYRLIPEMVIKPKDEEEVSYLLQASQRFKIPVTFRAAGTSLSGQAVTDSVLVIIGEYWNKFRISENAELISVQPGLTGKRINSALSSYGRKIGPDPASIDVAAIGGMVANNSSGMRSGIEENGYNTIYSMRIIFGDGTVLDTGNETSKNEFLKSHPKFIESILDLAKSVKTNVILSDKIRKKYKLKNTTGYSLNALVDFEDPFQIINNLMIGSEGTLGFISEITLRTFADPQYRASSFMIFPDIGKACHAATILRSTPVSAVELIDRSALRSVENEKGMPEFLKGLDKNASALLIETAANSKSGLKKQIELILEAISDIPVVLPIRFTDVEEEYNILWKIRKGLFPAVGGMRKSGTTVIIEDVAFPVQRLAEATLDLQNLLVRNNYKDAVIYGHALEGNMHFIFSQDFEKNEEVQRYERLMQEVSDLVVGKYDGSLKAEHGTGRNVAPFVEKEWGSDAYTVMKKIKQIFDPENLINPGVILNDDPKIHLRNLKPLPVANDYIDKCIECGFCEPFCVSNDLTLTPRQRIVVFREIFRLSTNGEQPHIRSSLLKDYNYQGDQTCATDGLCSLNCPVSIDTGKLIKYLRSQRTASAKRLTLRIAGNMKTVTASVRTFLKVIDFFHRIFGTKVMLSVSSGLRKISGNRIPQWNQYMPKGAGRILQAGKTETGNPEKVVYFPSCINRSMGTSRDHSAEKQLSAMMLQLIEKAGYEVIYPGNLDNLCCGMPFLSKGFIEAGTHKSRELEKALIEASKNGTYPILCDMSPCLYTMKENMAGTLKLFEPVEFITEYLLPHLIIEPLDEAITVFPVCSMKKMGLEQKLTDLAKLCARTVIVPKSNCCGFAGDRGFTFPELNKHGLRDLKSQITENVRYGYSTSRTCEIGLSLHSGIPFKSIVYLVDATSKPKKDQNKNKPGYRL
jgi:D-lactate dehydrogenase